MQFAFLQHPRSCDSGFTAQVVVWLGDMPSSCGEDTSEELEGLTEAGVDDFLLSPLGFFFFYLQEEEKQKQTKKNKSLSESQIQTPP